MADLPFSPRTGWLLLWLFRVALALFVVQGADVPDEWWQSTEVAYSVVFGEQQLTWEWWDVNALRSYTYPLPFIVLFWLLRVTGLDAAMPSLLYLLPRIMAATVCHLVDRATANVAFKRIFPRERAMALGLLLSCASWFVGFVGVRTQSNVVEALLLLWALEVDSFVAFILCCGLGCALRITFAVPALVLFAFQIWDRCVVGTVDGRSATELLPDKEPKSRHQVHNDSEDEDDDDDKKRKKAKAHGLDAIFGLHPRRRYSPGGKGGSEDEEDAVLPVLLRHLFVTALAVLLTLGAVAAIDRVFYGRWVCAPLNFLVFNVVSGLSKLFGTHPVHWYVTSALPVMFLTLTPMIAVGWRKGVLDAEPPSAFAHRTNAAENTKRTRAFVKRLLVVVGASTAAMSALGHKEMRFLFFTVPLAVLVAAAAWANDPDLWRRRKRWTAAHVLVNTLVLVFFGVFWQEAPLSVAAYLRSEARREDNSKGAKSLHALTHCFALPGRSFFHRAVGDFVHNACPVVMAAQNEREAGHPRYGVVQPTANDCFLESPLEFVEYVYEGKPPASQRFQRRMDTCGECQRNSRASSAVKNTDKNGGAADARSSMPDRLVLYDVHEQVLRPFLERNFYAKKKTFFHTWVPLEDYHGKSMVLYERVN